MAQTKVKTKGITDTNVTNAKLGTDISAAKLTAGTIDGDRLPSPTLTIKGDGSSNPAAIKLNCEQNSHGVTIKSPVHSSAANYTLTLPVNDGDADQFLKTDGSGVTSWAAAGGGLVLQTVGMTKTDTTSYGTASWADITGMSLAITPTKASSKILLNVNCSFGGRFAGMAAKVLVDIDGAGYNDLLVGDAAGSRTRCTWGLRQASSHGGYDGYSVMSKGMSYLYTPSYTLTDVITFKIQWNATAGTTIYLNRQSDNTDAATYVRTPSMMTAMEID